MIFGKWSDEKLAPRVQAMVRDEAIVRYGGGNIMRAGKIYNSLRYHEQRQKHKSDYENRWQELLRGNNSGEMPAKRLSMRDGWVRDDSGKLPLLDELLDQTNTIIEERGGKQHSDIQQPFLRNLIFPGDVERFPALLNFILSSEILDIAARHLGTIPVLSKTRPPGLRFMESNAALDPGDNGPLRASQNFHLDLHDTNLVYVLVLAHDVPEDGGPWHYLPKSVSDRACKGLRYRQPGANYRISDEEMYRHISPDEKLVFSGKKGDVLFIDSNRCFHYGSRHAVVPRFQVMYGLSTPCRADFSQTWMKEFPYPLSSDDSELRQMVLAPQSGL